MSVKIMGAVFDADLPRDEKHVLLSYADHAAHDGTSVYPSVERMAWKTGYSTRSIQIITRKLVKRGILIDDGRGPSGVNRWRIDVAMFPQRPRYQSCRGANSAGCRKQQEGVQKTTDRGAESAPNPSLTVNEPSHDADAPLADPSPSEQGPELVGKPALDAVFGERKTSKAEPVTSTGDWRTRIHDAPHLTWGAESAELTRQKLQYGARAEPVLKLGYELDKALGLRPVWETPAKVRTWTSGLYACLLAAEWDTGLVLATARKMREDKLTIKSPWSIEGMVEAAAAEKRSGGPGGAVFGRLQV